MSVLLLCRVSDANPVQETIIKYLKKLNCGKCRQNHRNYWRFKVLKLY